MKSLEITNEQLMKAIECCLIVDCDTCDYCPLYDRDNGCTEDGTYTLLERAFDLIKRLQTEIDILIRKKDTLREENAEQQAEIERKDKILNSYALQYGTVTDQSKKIQEIRTEAIKEFAERLKEYRYKSSDWSHGEHPMVVEWDDIENVIYELTEVKDDEKLD